MEEMLGDYRQETGREVVVQYGASQTLLTQLEVTNAADLFLPADESYLLMASDKDLITEILPIAQMRLVVAVPKGNPKQIASFDDLLREDVRLVQANPDAAAVGKIDARNPDQVGRLGPIGRSDHRLSRDRHGSRQRRRGGRGRRSDRL